MIMEIAFDLSAVFQSNLVRLDSIALRRLHPRRFWAVQKFIDQMGRLSSEAQGLKRTLTTYDKIADSDENQVLYILWQKSEKRENLSNIIGMLKIGRKNLFLFDQSHNYELSPVCILDFYVFKNLQRQGYGHYIYDFMLQSEGISPSDCAIDKPSDNLLKFMQKHYGLIDPIWQNTNYVVYPQFFQRIQSGEHNSPIAAAAAPIAPPIFAARESSTTNEKNHEQITTEKTALKSNGRWPSTDRQSVAGIIHGSQPIPERQTIDKDSAKGRKNTRDFGHQAIF